MAEAIRIANCSGYFGDRISAAREMVDGGPIDVLTGDWLAELTMLILAKIRAKRPGGGYAGTFVTQMEQVMGTCLDRGIKVVSNAGGLDPAGCAEALSGVAAKLGLDPVIAYVDGDDLSPRLEELVASGTMRVFGANGTDGGPIEAGLASRFLTANAYLGCWGIVDALSAGADIVVTGRVTDAAVVCGPAAWHHGWARDDWNALAGAVAAGHVIECGAQATGGNYSFFHEIDGYDRPGAGARFGFPWAEVASDGSSLIGKHDGTGGAVTVGTVTSQLLYEIGGPRYFGPDVTARFDALRLEQVERDRVRMSGAAGEPPPTTLKVATNLSGGYRNSVVVALTGLDIEAKARFVEATFWDACPVAREDFDEVSIALSRTDHDDPDSNDRATAKLTITVKDRDAAKVGRAFSDAVIQTALSSIPGFHALSGAPGGGNQFGVYLPATVPAIEVPQHVHLGGDDREIPSVAPVAGSSEQLPDEPGTASALATVSTTRVPLGTVVGARSGDKGGDANLGVFARTDAGWAWLDEFLTVARLAELLPEAATLPIRRYRFPNLRSLNFVIEGLLGDGVAASTRPDAQAKSLGEWLRARQVDVPDEVLAAS